MTLNDRPWPPPRRIPGAGPAVLAVELLGRVRAELPVIGPPMGVARRLARTEEVGSWEQLLQYSLRHSAITFALDADASLRDAQD